MTIFLINAVRAGSQLQSPVQRIKPVNAAMVRVSVQISVFLPYSEIQFSSLKRTRKNAREK